MISVIIPVYNTEKYLRKCVESVVAQTYADLEIILVDDGSPDNAGKLCDELAKEDSRIAVIHQRNGGLAAARNSGLAYAMNGGLADQGHYVTFVDSDDSIDKNMYALMSELAEKNHADLVLCGCQSVKGEQDILACTAESTGFQVLDSRQIWDEVFGRLNNSACNKLYRADLCKGLVFPQGIIHGEDLLFNLRYIEKCETAVKVDNAFYHYFCRHGSITRSSFNSNKFNEITAKDVARDAVAQSCPRLLQTANVFCFRSRMNVLRSIYKNGADKKFGKEVQQCRRYVHTNFPNVNKYLKKKERIEFILMEKVFPVYLFMTKRMR